MLSIQDELSRKALEQVAHLLSSYGASKITAESFRVGVETIWAVLGGVVETDAFQELMVEANAEIAGLPSPPHTRLFSNGANIVALMRASEQVNMLAGATGSAGPKQQTFAVDDEAIEHVKSMSTALLAKGYEELTR